MSKFFYLHLGFHKTGTTSFQHFCSKNRKELSERGITYPIFSAKEYRQDLPFDLENHSIPLYSLFTREPEKYYFNKISQITDVRRINQSYYNQLVSQLSKAENFLVSGEDLATLHPDGLISLCTLAQNEGYTIKPFAFIRPPFALLNSAIQEQIKNGIYWPIIGLNRAPQSLDIKKVGVRNDISRIKNLIHIFGESIKFIPYERACNHSKGLINYLLSEVLCLNSIKNIDFSIEAHKNSSRNNLWTRLQNQVNKNEPLIKNNMYNTNHYKIRQFEDSKAEKFKLTALEFKFIEEQFFAIREELKGLLSADYLAEEIRFSDTIETHLLITTLLEQLKAH